MVRGINRIAEIFAVIVIAAAFAFIPASPSAANESFDQWLEGFKRDAELQGIDSSTLREAFRGVRQMPDVIERDRKQPEFTFTFRDYMARLVNDTRIADGRDRMHTHSALLEAVSREYGVPARYLTAFWGLESNYGANTGGYYVIAALATLAHDPRRSEFFRTQLLYALRILQENHVTRATMTGSWAGAMGQLQFIPSTFAGYAVDRDGDGRRDIWETLPDVFGSAANYLASQGWTPGQPWGTEIKLPQGFDWSETGLDTRKSLSQWRRMGVRPARGESFEESSDTMASILVPAGYRGPAFLVYGNFRVILRWNQSIFYAIAIGHLADRLDGGAPLVAKPDEQDRPLSRDDVKEMQRMLAALGFDAGPVDGVVGSRTRSAVRAFQRDHDLPADGYPSGRILEKLRDRVKQ